MHSNLERRFTELEVARMTHELKLRAFSGRFAMLFSALADDLEISIGTLAERIGWGPVPEHGNKIMRGEAEPSREDCYRLLCVYLAADRTAKPLDVPRCEKCGWPLADSVANGCVAGNCSMRD
jgi:hypothetical protein